MAGWRPAVARSESVSRMMMPPFEAEAKSISPRMSVNAEPVVDQPSVRFAATAVEAADGMFSVVSVVKPDGLVASANSALFGNGIAGAPHSDGFVATGSNSE